MKRVRYIKFLYRYWIPLHTWSGGQLCTWTELVVGKIETYTTYATNANSSSLLIITVDNLVGQITHHRRVFVEPLQYSCHYNSIKETTVRSWYLDVFRLMKEHITYRLKSIKVEELKLFLSECYPSKCLLQISFCRGRKCGQFRIACPCLLSVPCGTIRIYEKRVS